MNKAKIRSLLIVTVIILLCFVTRLPQILSHNFILDGDECTEGLMAKHMYEGKELPLYFYGQHYGFSLIETSAICISYFFFGQSDYSIKLAMLALWTIGILFFYKTLKQVYKEKDWLAEIVTLVFIFSPAWAAWSMKARGGYLSAFFLSFIVTYLLFHREYAKKTGTYFFIGLLLVLIWHCQVLWIAGLVPFVVCKLYQEKNAQQFINLGSGIVAMALVFLLLRQPGPDVFEPISLAVKTKWVVYTPELLFNHFTGFYYLWFAYESPLACTIFSYLFIGLMLFLVAAGIWYFFKKRRGNTLFIVSVISVCASLIFPLFIRGNNARYVLPVTGYVLFSVFCYAANLKKLLPAYAGMTLLVVVGAAALINFKDYKFNPVSKEALGTELNFLEKQNIHYVFCTDGLMEWQVLFYSGEKIIARTSLDPDRYEPYVKTVDSVYKNQRGYTAIIGYRDNAILFPADSVNYQTEGYFIIRQPDRNMLKKMGITP